MTFAKVCGRGPEGPSHPCEGAGGPIEGVAETLQMGDDGPAPQKPSMEHAPELDLTSWISALSRMSAPHPELLRSLQVIGCLQDRPVRLHALLLGEPGTGKEGLARLLHRLMHPRGAPIERVATAGRDEADLEAALFGHGEGGRPEGALWRNAGGAVILEELLDLSPRLQRLLHEALRLGRLPREDAAGAAPDAPELPPVIIGVSDHDLGAAVAEGRFRHDLYYRLARVVLRLPPLRERPEDVSRAALWMCNRVLRGRAKGRTAALADSASGDTYAVLPEAIEALRAHTWPGNFRELEAVIERAVLLFSDGTCLRAEDVAGALMP